MSGNKTEKRWTVEVVETDDPSDRSKLLYRGHELYNEGEGQWLCFRVGTNRLRVSGMLGPCLAFIDEQEDGKR